MAEGVGFEPTSPFGETVFKTAAIDHSAIPPGKTVMGRRLPQILTENNIKLSILKICVSLRPIYPS